MAELDVIESKLIDLRSDFQTLQNDFQNLKDSDHQQSLKLDQYDQQVMDIVNEINLRMAKLQSHLKALADGHNSKNDNVVALKEIVFSLEAAQESLTNEYFEQGVQLRKFKITINELRNEFEDYRRAFDRCQQCKQEQYDSLVAKHCRLVYLIVAACGAVLTVLTIRGCS